MSKKVILQVNSNDDLTDFNGVHILQGFSSCNYAMETVEDNALSVESIIELKKAGFAYDEIMEMHKKGVMR